MKYHKAKLTIIITILLILLLVGSVQAESIMNPQHKAVLHSLLLPGWGQFDNKQPQKGLVIAGSEVVLIGGAIIEEINSDKAYDRYNSATGNDIEYQYNKANRYHKTGNYLAICAVLLWGYNVLDSYIYSKKSSLAMDMEKDRFIVSYKITF